MTASSWILQTLPWVLQILILAAGIHFFLRFVRTTRGSRLIRGLLVTVTVGFVGLWGLAKSLDLEELSHLLHGSTGFIVVAFVIVFQQEVRRAIAQLGEHSFVGRLMNPAGGDTLKKTVRAARSMASRRTGALIAFERETSLEPYLEAGTELDAAVTARLLETVFHPGSPLHDGGVVVRRDRVARAGCIFPLPQEGVIDPRLGTRHRAAVGLTEDTDAVVLVVSEETGAISLAHRGRLRTVISPEEVEEELRRMVEDGEEGGEVAEKGRGGLAAWRRDLLWFPASLLLATGILYVAHQDIRVTKQFRVQISGAPATPGATPRENEILVKVRGENWRLFPVSGTPKIVVAGTRAQLEELGDGLAGIYEVTQPDRGEVALLLGEVNWQKPVIGLDYEWADQAPVLRLGRFDQERITLTAGDVTVDDAHLNPHYEVLRDRISFEPEASVVLRGPSRENPREVADLLQPVVLEEDDLNDVRERVRLRPQYVEAGYSLEGVVHVVIPIAPARREAGTLTKEIALLTLDPDRIDELSQWVIPAHAQTARVRIETAGLIPVGSDPGSEAFRERTQAIRRYVAENLLVYVDISELPPEGEGQSVKVHCELRGDWKSSLDSLVGLDKNRLVGRESLDVMLESDERIRLERRNPETEPGPGN